MLFNNLNDHKNGFRPKIAKKLESHYNHNDKLRIFLLFFLSQTSQRILKFAKLKLQKKTISLCCYHISISYYSWQNFFNEKFMK